MMSTILTVIVGAIASAITWVAVHWAGKPILDVRAARIEALRVAELYGCTGYGASREDVEQASAALSAAAMSIRSLVRGQPWAARLYCSICGYDLEMAARVLIGLQHLVGENLAKESTSRRDQVRALHVLLNAHRHLKADEIKDIRAKLELAENDVGSHQET